MARRSGEAAVIAAFCGALRTKTRSEDAELFRLGGAGLAVSIDTLVASTDIPPTMSLRDAARKSVASCVSDFAAKGVRPAAAVVSVILPRRISAAQVRQISGGIAAGAREFGICVLGGDTNEGKEIAISVCVLGRTPRRVPRRAGSRVGDIIMTTGAFGYAAAGLVVAVSPRRLAGSARFLSRARRALIRPTPPLAFCLRSSASFTASMDSSDGLAATLHEMAAQSGVRFELDALPVGSGVREFAALNGLDAADLVLYGGEEYETVFTCRQAACASLQRRASALGVDLCKIGRVVRGRGVYATDSAARFRVKDRAWQHLLHSKLYA